VFNLRYGSIFAVAAFVLSLLIGLVSRSTMPMLIIRPLIFAALFFIFSVVGKILVTRFLPELLEETGQEEDAFRPGSRIDILEDDGEIFSPDASDRFTATAPGQVSTGARPDDSEDGLGDISELSRRSAFSPVAGGSIAGIDQNVKEGYTKESGLGDSAGPDFSKMFDTDSSFGASTGGGRIDLTDQSVKSHESGQTGTAGILSSEETLPDLDSMAGAFMAGSSDEESEAAGYSASGPFRKPSSDKAPKWTEDFNAKEIAMGLRTVLSKDKEG
jgi:hypothetical protein